MKIKEKHTRKLLVEGNDDQHIIWALCERFSISEVFDVIDCGGIANLYESISLRFKQTNIETVGIIIDADINLNNRWEQIRSLLLNQGFNIPENLPNDGLVLSKDNIKVGVWIMPSNDTNGMIEDFMTFLVPQNDELLPIVDATLNEIENRNLNKYSLIHKSKARIHSWLSWQEDPGTPMGLSITKRYLTTDRESCNRLVNWLLRLFID